MLEVLLATAILLSRIYCQAEAASTMASLRPGFDLNLCCFINGFQCVYNSINNLNCFNRLKREENKFEFFKTKSKTQRQASSKAGDQLRLERRLCWASYDLGWDMIGMAAPETI